jgi:hypothetical protein
MDQAGGDRSILLLFEGFMASAFHNMNHHAGGRRRMSKFFNQSVKENAGNSDKNETILVSYM